LNRAANLHRAAKTHADVSLDKALRPGQTPALTTAARGRIIFKKIVSPRHEPANHLPKKENPTEILTADRTDTSKAMATTAAHGQACAALADRHSAGTN
jgi:hypothetical protein